MREELQTKTNCSVESIASVLKAGALPMPLWLFCKYIAEHKSLSNATIISASSYNERVHLVIKHRFLLLNLRREGRKDVWLRLDRRSSPYTNPIEFTASGLVSEAYDTVRAVYLRRNAEVD